MLPCSTTRSLAGLFIISFRVSYLLERYKKMDNFFFLNSQYFNRDHKRWFCGVEKRFLYVMNRKKSAELCILNNWTGVLNTRKWIHESAAWVYSLECIQHSSEIMKNTKFSTSLRFITFFIPWVYIYHFDQIQNVNFTTTMLSFGFCR